MLTEDRCRVLHARGNTLSCVRWSINNILRNARPEAWWSSVIYIVPSWLERAVESVTIYWMVISPKSISIPGGGLFLVDIILVVIGS